MLLIFARSRKKAKKTATLLDGRFFTYLNSLTNTQIFPADLIF